MGFALAKEAADLGAEVIIVSGPTMLNAPLPEIKLINIVSAREMYDAVHRHFKEVDVVIAAAAVSDYKPKIVATQN